MAKVGKKYAEAAKLFDKQKQYDVAEAIDILKKMDTAKSVSYTHSPSPRDATLSRMPSSA